MGIFSHDDNGGSSQSANHTCPMPTDYALDGVNPFIADLSFRQFNMILSGACTAVTTLVILTLMTLHATHLSKPREQIKIMKISGLLPMYSILSWLCLAFPKQASSIDPWIDVFEAFALGAFFLLLCEFISSDSRTELDLFFSAFQLPKKKGKKQVGGLPWFRKRWIAIFQYPPVAILVSIVTDITQAAGIYCEESSKPYFAHIYLMAIGTASLAFAVVSILGFYSALKSELKGHSPLAKLMAFKLIVGLSFLETILFTILRSTDTLKPNDTLTYGDVIFGIPNLVVCLQTVPFALFFPFAYSHKPYILSNQRAALNSAEEGQGKYQNIPGEADLLRYQGGPLGIRAWTEMLNPTELWGAIRFAFNMATKSKERTVHSTAGYEQNTSYEMSYEAQRPLSNETLIPPTYPQHMYPGYDNSSAQHSRSPSRDRYTDSQAGNMPGAY